MPYNDLRMPPISHQIWDAKYRWKNDHGEPMDQTIQDSWRRVASALASAESTGHGQFQGQFYEALKDFKFLPAGRIFAGAGTNRKVTLFNCYVMGTIEDSLSGIFSHLKEAALTMQQGGGIGYDFSTIRPKGSLVKGVSSDASGPLSFMDVWNSMCKTIMSAGARRGAMMATIRCDHPDVVEFIRAKREPGRLTNFNLSVLVTDAFMAAVEKNQQWHLVFEGKTHHTMAARELWDLIMSSTYEYAEPGVIFIDRINQDNNLYYNELISATNPCGEQPLPPYGACLLGSINLAAFVCHPFSIVSGFDFELMQATVRTAVRMMDNVVDVSNFPLLAQEEEAKKKKRLGLGVTGTADALFMLGQPYGSGLSVSIVEEVLCRIRDWSYDESIELAKEKGAFPNFHPDYVNSRFIQRLPDSLINKIRKHGIRNSHLTSIAPTGTISLVARNVSSGIEPIFAASYIRKVLQKDGSKTEEEVKDYAVALWDEMRGGSPLPDYFRSVDSLSPSDHVTMQGSAQAYVDSAISKTINLPKEISFEDFKAVYTEAYENGCKGCTTYRPNDVTGSILSSEPTSKPSEELLPTPKEALIKRPDVLEGRTYKLRWPGIEAAFYITITDIDEAGAKRPFEIFINSRGSANHDWCTALARMISACMRRGGDLSFIPEELESVHSPAGYWIDGKFVPSMVALIGQTIRKHMGFMGSLEVGEVSGPEEGSVRASVDLSTSAPICEKCGLPGCIQKDGCLTCPNCGYSKCE